jgi:hypothetical protein
VDLTRPLARTLVEKYLADLSEPGSTVNRAMGEVVERERSGPPAERRPTSFYAALGRALLPQELLDSLRRRKPDCVLIVPDGPLHSLPFEALVVSDDSRTPFLIDREDFPPIAYAPSANIWATLIDRGEAVGRGPWRLLTVGNPAHAEPAPGSSTSLVQMVRPVEADRLRSALLALGRHLPPLKHTQTEFERIEQAFQRRLPDSDTKLLVKANATEREFRANVDGRTIIRPRCRQLLLRTTRTDCCRTTRFCNCRWPSASWPC